jgi:adenine phosphoribosyltransferase
MNLKDKIRIIQDFPKDGISFKDITTLLQDKEAYKYTVDSLVDICKGWKPELVVGPEARGFVIGAPLAYALGIGFVPVRKPGKLPGKPHILHIPQHIFLTVKIIWSHPHGSSTLIEDIHHTRRKLFIH